MGCSLDGCGGAAHVFRFLAERVVVLGVCLSSDVGVRLCIDGRFQCLHLLFVVRNVHFRLLLD